MVHINLGVEWSSCMRHNIFWGSLKCREGASSCPYSGYPFAWVDNGGIGQHVEFYFLTDEPPKRLA
jgi:hypothetical protein